jgi:hypothetical protein
MRAVLLPAAVVLVVNIPAEGFLLRTSGGESELSAASAKWYESGLFDAAVFVVVDGGGGGIVSGGAADLGNSREIRGDVKETLIPLWAALTGRKRRAITTQLRRWGWIGIDRSLKLYQKIAIEMMQ